MREAVLIYSPLKVPSFSAKDLELHRDMCELTDRIMNNAVDIDLPERPQHYSPGLLWFASYMKKLGLSVRIIDINEFVEDPNRFSFIGFSVTAPDVPEILRIVKRLRNKGCKSVIGLGGAYCHYCPDDDLLSILAAGVDVVDRGSGTQIASMLANKVDIHKTPSLIISSPWKDLFTKVSCPDYDLIPNSLEKSLPHVFTSVGCKGACVYCSCANSKFFERNLMDVKTELLEIEKRVPKKRLVHFTDCNLAQSGLRLKQLLQVLPASLRYSCDLHLSSIKENLLREMWDAGFVRINIGIEDQNCNRAWLKMKAITNLDLKLRRIRNSFPGIVRGYFLVGLPGNGKNRAKHYLTWLKKLLTERLVDIATIKTLVPYPGTRLHSSPEEYGITILTPDLEKYTRLNHPVYSLHEMGCDDIEKWLREALFIVRKAYQERLLESTPVLSEGSCNYFRHLLK